MTFSTKKIATVATLFASLVGFSVFANNMSPIATAHANGPAKLVVGTEAGYAPFEYLNEKAELVGFDIELAKYICNDLKVTCEFKNQSFDSLIPSVKFKKLDFAIAALNSTPEREKIISFTKPYLPENNTHLLVVAKKNANKKITDLKTIGYQSGTLAGTYVNTKIKTAKGKNYDTNDLALIEVKSGRIDGLLLNAEVAYEFAKDPAVTTLGKEIVDPQTFGSGLCIAVNKSNTDLLNKLNAAIDKATKDGTINKLKAKYGIK